MQPLSIGGATDSRAQAIDGSLPPLRAIRVHCLGCAGTSNEVANCASTRCPLWLFRFGHRPDPSEVSAVADLATCPRELPMTQDEVTTGSRLKAIRRRCTDCSGGSIAEVRGCKHSDCALHYYRMGKSIRTMSDQQRAAAADRMRRNLASVAQRQLPPEIPDESAPPR